MRRDGYSSADLRMVQAEVEKILTVEGVPSDSLSNFTTGRVRCEVHSESIVLDLRLTDTVGIRIAHCGCDWWLKPVAPAPSDMVAMARDLAEEILWCWEERENAFALMAAIREALEREVGKAAHHGLDWQVLDVWMADFETFRGRHLATRAAFYLLHDSLLGKYRRTEWFDTPASVRRFFRSTRHYQIYLKERQDELAKFNAIGAVDKVVANALRSLGIDPLYVIANYKTDGFPNLGGRDLILRWKAGILLGVFNLAPGIQWQFGNTYFWDDNHQSRDFDRAHERTIGDFGVSPLLPPNAPIKYVGRYPTYSNLAIEPEIELFGLVDGKFVWVEAEGATALTIGMPPEHDSGPSRPSLQKI